MDKKMNLTWKELQLLHVACMMYGNELSDISKNSSSAERISESLKGRAEELWNLGKKIKNHMDGVYGADYEIGD